MNYLQFIENSVEKSAISPDGMALLYLPDEQLADVKKMSRSTHWLFNREETINDYNNYYLTASQIIGAAIYRHKVNTSIYYVFGRSSTPFQALYMPVKNQYVVIIDVDSLDAMYSLCSALKNVYPLSNLLGEDSLVQESSFFGMSMLDIVRSLCVRKINVNLHISENNPRLFQAAMTYAVAHELAHLFNGHLPFLKHEDYCEVSKDQEDIDLTQRTLEMDADSLAVDWIFEFWETASHRYVDPLDQPQDEKEIILDWMRITYITGVFIAGIYRDSREKPEGSTKYPSGYARFLIAQVLLEEAFSSNSVGQGQTEEARNSIVMAFATLSNGVDNLNHPLAQNVYFVPNTSGQLIPSYKPEVMVSGARELEPLNSRWAKLRPMLNKHRLGRPLAPPSAEAA